MTGQHRATGIQQTGLQIGSTAWADETGDPLFVDAGFEVALDARNGIYTSVLNNRGGCKVVVSDRRGLAVGHGARLTRRDLLA